jgi:hypothetical protein
MTNSYTMVLNGPPPLSWSEYEAIVTREWGDLLLSDLCGNERAVQTMLERHPCLIPGPFGMYPVEIRWPARPAGPLGFRGVIRPPSEPTPAGRGVEILVLLGELRWPGRSARPTRARTRHPRPKGSTVPRRDKRRPFGPGGTGHAPFPAAVISQPVLPDLTCRIPDFMWIAKNSVAIYPNLIEIEAPNKRWFTKAGQPSADLTQAQDQLTQWKSWFAEPLNAARFKELYQIEHDFLPLKPIYILIYGRREEANRSRQHSKKRVHMDRPDEILMTFDRLQPDPKTSDFLCVKITLGGYRAITIPPTIRLGPSLAGTHGRIRDKGDAVRSSPYLTGERKEFLVERFDYWDDCSRQDRMRVVRLSDRE